MKTQMEVTKRNGETQKLRFDKITERIENLCTEEELDELDIPMVVQKTISNIFNGIKTSELDIMSAEICQSLSYKNPIYGDISSRISVSNLHKETDGDFMKVITKLFNANLVSKLVFDVTTEHQEKIKNEINYNNDFTYTYFGLKTLESSYLIKLNGKKIERPQDMLMRVSIGIHGNNIDKIIESYHDMSHKKFTHASPTLFNSGTNRPQLSSCFLMGTGDDLNTMYRTTCADCAEISKHSGGIGIHISNLRGNDSVIRGVNGKSKGIVPYLKVLEATANHVDQGGKRNGSFAIYLECWHCDILEFVELRKPTGDEKLRTRDLFLALWVSDNFMVAVQNDLDWYLMCPDESPGLTDCYGTEFNKLYESYVEKNNYRNKIKARYLWNKILESQIESGMPYMCYKDNVNNKSNQQNIGPIKSSNLCAEICEFSDEKEETAVCNLASIAVNNFIEEKEITDEFIIYSKTNCEYCDLVKMLLKKHKYKHKIIVLDDKNERIKLYNKIDDEHDTLVDTMPQIFTNDNYLGGFKEFQEYIRPVYNFDKLKNISSKVCYNLNKIIDINYYPTEKCKNSNLKHRPIGIGIQGLADAYIKMRFSFDSKEAEILNKEIMEAIYFGALEESVNLAIKEGKYETFDGSAFSKGILQFDMWNVEPSSRWNWTELKNNIKLHGTRNSLLTALMPTASTSQILGNNECFEPYTSNIYNRKTKAGEYKMVNKEMIIDLKYLNMWNDDIKSKIIKNYGSIQNIEGIPKEIKNIYKVVWEINQKCIVQQAIDRGPYVDQSQSMNIWMAEPNMSRLQKSHFYSWKNGLKTGMYYLRSKPAANAIQFTESNENECISCSG